MEFDVACDCDKLAAQATNVRKDPQIGDYDIKFRRKTVECESPSGKWCTKECWDVTIDYSVTSDLDPSKKFKNENISLGTVCCECQCVNIVGHTISIEGHDIQSSGLKNDAGNYHTDYTVQYTGSVDGNKSVTWVQGQRVEGSRSWYGYGYFKQFVIRDASALPAFYQQLAVDGISPPGLPLPGGAVAMPPPFPTG